MKFEYCPFCRKVLELKEIGDDGLTPFCDICQRPYFDWFGQCTLSAVINEFNEIALLKQGYVSKTNWVLVAGYIKNGETLEETAVRKVFEETEQILKKIEYISSYYYEKRELLMIGFKCDVEKKEFNKSIEVDTIQWYNVNKALKLLREGSIGQLLLNNIMEKYRVT